MALAYHTEGSTSFAAAAWSDTTGFAAGATLIVDYLGAQAITTNVDQSAVAQVDYLRISRNFSGSIGTASSPLKFGANSASLNAKGFFNDAGGGVIYFQAANIVGSGTVNTIAYYSHSGPASAYAVGGSITTVDQAAGRLEVGQSTVVTTVNHAGGYAFYDYNATAITTLNVRGGTVYLKRGVTTLNIYGGTVIYDNTVDMTTGFVGPAGALDHRGGNIPTCTILGTYTCQYLRRSATVGSSAFTSWAGANINRNTPAGVAVTFSNETKVAGGTLTYSASGGFGA